MTDYDYIRERGCRLSANYVISFGKYKGRKMRSMNSEEEMNYCAWVYYKLKETLTLRKKNQSREYKAFSWAIRIKED
jgi:hypothetical protein